MFNFPDPSYNWLGFSQIERRPLIHFSSSWYHDAANISVVRLEMTLDIKEIASTEAGTKQPRCMMVNARFMASDSYSGSYMRRPPRIRGGWGAADGV